MTRTKKAKRKVTPKRKRVRCKYRKGETLEHREWGMVTVHATKKVGPTSFTVQIIVPNPHGHREDMLLRVSETHLLANAKKVA